MKKFLFLTVLLAGFVTVSFAQSKTAKIETPTIQQCDACEKLIMDYLVREPGVTKVKVYAKYKYVKVTYITNRTNEENIKAAIANVGFDAGDVKASKEAYDRLPGCCKKPASEGGKE